MILSTYTLKYISQILKGKLLINNNDATINHVIIDSRKIVAPENSLFFAIKGERHDGHEFISELYEKGVRNFVVSEPPKEIKNFYQANFIQVENTLIALQLLCASHRKRFKIPVIGITGSNGKTVIKEWLYQLLREDKNIVRSPKSYNSQVGVPLSVWQMKPEHELAIFEAGISRPGEMEKLQFIIQPSIGILTNIGEAHSEGFNNLWQKANEKLRLFPGVETLIYCKDHKEIDECISVSSIRCGTFTWSKRKNAGLQIIKVAKGPAKTEIHGKFKNKSIRIIIPYTDDASIENAIHCWAFMLHQKYDNKTIARRMQLLAPVAMRLELKEGINNCTIINDSYNSDIGSLEIALDFMNQQKQHTKKTVILSDILQSGKDEKKLYKEVSGLLNKKKINRMIGIGEAISKQAGQFNTGGSFFTSTDDFVNKYSNSFFLDETILLKGARPFKFERISKLLQKKAHETVLEVNLSAIVNNLNYFRSKIKPGTKIMAMVKAFSYGSGSYEIANVLQFHRADYLVVAYADEGIELRQAGIKTPIMVMNPEEHGYDAMLKYDLEPEIYNFHVLELFEEAIKKSPKANSLPMPVHIKIETGMHRLGFENEDLRELVDMLKTIKDIYIKSVFSHLAAADEPEHDAFTGSQIKRFTEMSDSIISRFDYPILRHILNSAGTIRFPEAQFDMVRLGIGLYGVGTHGNTSLPAGRNALRQAGLQNVSTLKSSISQIKNVPAKETIGYGRKGIAEKNMKIAIVPIGYADGLSRKLGNGRGKLLLNGKFAPVIGNICMDMCMIDITGIPANEGDEVIIFGEEYPITEFAKNMDTIPYEVLTGISRRVKRVYFQE